MHDWPINRSRETYGITHWGGNYFDVGAQGHMEVAPAGIDRPRIDLHELAGRIEASGLSLPVLVRFPDILNDRVKQLCKAFEVAMRDYEFDGGYRPAYPIKVNQQRTVVESIVATGMVGLEAGSKPELMAVLGILEAPAGLVICNGYKDREYIRLALIGQQLGSEIYIVIEKLSELAMVIEEARSLGVRPRLGVRVRLASIGRGKWQDSGGDRSKFGLTAAGVLQMVERLTSEGMLETLQLLHVHLGSQIANIRDIHTGLHEAGRYFAELSKLGAPVSNVDVGGGLGIDYEGTRSRSQCSINYSLQEYANSVVHAIAETCDAENLPHPRIITESGRALTAHHAVMLCNIIDVTRTVPGKDPATAPDENSPAVLHYLWEALENADDTSMVETHHECIHWLAEAQTMFVHGLLDMQERALAEDLVARIRASLYQRLNPSIGAHRQVIDELNDMLADKYFCNLSIFQSLPDIWAIDQIFPIVPLHRLDEEPDRRVVLEDITCDSDGRIENYVSEESIGSTLRLHAPRDDEAYRIGIFLVGAYQEILGDLHNLFGDTHSIDVVLDGNEGYELERPMHGDGVDDVLRYVHFDPDELRQAYRRRIAAANLDESQRADYLDELNAGLTGYTYLEE